MLIAQKISNQRLIYQVPGVSLISSQTPSLGSLYCLFENCKIQEQVFKVYQQHKGYLKDVVNDEGLSKEPTALSPFIPCGTGSDNNNDNYNNNNNNNDDDDNNNNNNTSLNSARRYIFCLFLS